MLVIDIDPRSLSSYSEKDHAWILEPGKYGIWIGNSSRDVSLETVLEVKEPVILEKTEHICPSQGITQGA